MKKKKKVSNLYVSLITLTIIPILVLGVCVSIFVYSRFTGSMEHKEEIILRNTAMIVQEAYDNAYPGDYKQVGDTEVAIVKGEKVINGENEIITRVSRETGCEITLFYKNVRVLTTIVDDHNQQLVGTTARKLIYNQLIESGESQFYDNTYIDGKSYYSYYMPLFNSNGSFAGIIGVAGHADEVKKEIRNSVFPVILIVLVSTLLMALLCYRYTDNLIRRIKKVKKFLKSTENGDFSSEIDEKELNKSDEISEMEKSAMSMQKTLRKLIEQDSLTGINNRRYGNKFLIETQKKMVEEGVPYCVAIGDIDYFKKVNDTYGHEAGDKVLIEVAGILKKSMVGKGFVARWGGEEFLLVYTKNEVNDVMEDLKEMMSRIQRKTIPYNGKNIHVTMTIGITDGTEEPIHMVLNRADNNLYKGKQNGRNRVIR